MDNGRSIKTKRGEKEMVKYYFQSLNGSLAFVHAGTKEELEAKVKKEFGGDKEEAKARIQASIDEAEKRLDELQRVDCTSEKQQLENDIKIATLKNGIYDAKQELSRVGELQKADLVFFELNPIDLDIE